MYVLTLVPKPFSWLGKVGMGVLFLGGKSVRREIDCVFLALKSVIKTGSSFSILPGLYGL